ncbi:hypothetical protein BLOT_007215 [Blomia tropicalis]|nr:hypothetical protein BLOT_007215 [Blomia tropicalis]
MDSNVEKAKNVNQNLKRIIHNVNERKRKNRLVEIIDQLVDLLPMKCVGKLSRLKRMERLHEYILELRRKVDGLMFANPTSVHVLEIQRLTKYVEHLEKLNENYRKLLQIAGISAGTAIELGDREWSKPLKYSEKIYLDDRKQKKLIRPLKKYRKKRSCSDIEDNISDSSSIESEEVSDSELDFEKNISTKNNKGTNEPLIQLINSSTSVQLPQVTTPQPTFLLVSAGPNQPAQLVPFNQGPILLSSNTSTTASFNQQTILQASSTTATNKKTSQNKKKLNKLKDKAKTKKENKRTKNLKNENNRKNDSANKKTNLLTTTIEESSINKDDSTMLLSVEHKLQNSSSSPELIEDVNEKIPEESKKKPPSVNTLSDNVNLENKKNKLKSPSNVQEKVNETKMLQIQEPIVYDVEDEDEAENISNEPNCSQTLTSTTSSATISEPKPNRCNYSTESLLQQSSSTSTAPTQQSTNQDINDTTMNTNQDHGQTSVSTSYHQSIPSFTVKDSLINSVSISSSIAEKTSDPNTSPISSKRNMVSFELDHSNLTFSNSAPTQICTPTLFDTTLTSITNSIGNEPANQQQITPQLNSLVNLWQSEPSSGSSNIHNVSIHNNQPSTGTSTSVTQTQSYSTNPGVFFPNQPFSILSTSTTTPFDPPNVFVSPHHHHPRTSSTVSTHASSSFNATNFITPDFVPSTPSVSTSSSISTNYQGTTNGTDQVSDSTAQELEPYLTRSRSSRIATRSNSGATTSTHTYGTTSKSKNSKASTTSNSSNRNSKANSSSQGSKKNSSTSKANSSTDGKNGISLLSTVATCNTSTSSLATSTNLFSHRTHHHPHHTHHSTTSGHGHHHVPPRPPLLNDNYLHIIPDIISPAFVSATSGSSHPSSSMPSANINSSGSTFQTHSAPPPPPPPSQFSHSHHHSYSNFFGSSATTATATMSQTNDNQSSSTYVPYDSSNNESLTSTSNDIGNEYPLFRPQTQGSNVTPGYQSSSSSTSYTRTNITNPSMHSSQGPSSISSNHVPNFNLSNIFPDITSLNSGNSNSSSYPDFSSGNVSSVSKSRSTTTTASSSVLTTPSDTSFLPKFSHLTKSLAPPTSMDYQNTGTSHNYHHPSHFAYPPPPPQTSSTYTSATPHFSSHNVPSSSQNRVNSSSTSRHNSTTFTMDDLDQSASATRISGSRHYYHHIHNQTHSNIPSSSSDMSMFQSATNQSHHQPHHLNQHNQSSANQPFNQTSSSTSSSTFNLPSSATSRFGSTNSNSSTIPESSSPLPPPPPPPISFPLFNIR